MLVLVSGWSGVAAAEPSDGCGDPELSRCLLLVAGTAFGHPFDAFAEAQQADLPRSPRPRPSLHGRLRVHSLACATHCFVCTPPTHWSHANGWYPRPRFRREFQRPIELLSNRR